MWKKDKQDKRIRQNLKLALVALLILGLLLIFGRVVQFFSEFQKPFYNLNSKQREYSWNGNSVLNVIVAQADDKEGTAGIKYLHFVSLSPGEEKITIIKLSDEIFLNLPKNFGSWKLGSAYKLGQENKPAIGEDLIKMSVSKLLGLPVDGIIEVSSNNDLDFEKDVQKWRSNLFLGFAFLTRIKTDLSLKESVYFITRASKIRQDKINSLDLFKSTITTSKLLPDSSRVLGVDSIKLDTFIKQNVNDSVILDEDLTVAVYNGTNHPGLTEQAVRLINNLGARVTIVSNTADKFVRNGIYINAEENESVKSSATYKRLSEIFAPACLKSVCTTSDQEVSGSRAVISIVLGEEYFNYWSSR